MRKMVPLRSAMALTLVVALLAFLAGSYNAPVPAQARPRRRPRSDGRCRAPGRRRLSPEDAAKLLVETIDKTSGGRLKIELSPAGAVVPPFEIQDAVNRGVLDAGHTTPGYIIGKLKAFIPLTHGPLFGMDFIDYYGWYWEGGGHELLNEAYQQQLKMNVVSFQVHPEGPQAMGWFKKEIRSFADIKGQRYRIYRRRGRDVQQARHRQRGARRRRDRARAGAGSDRRRRVDQLLGRQDPRHRQGRQVPLCAGDARADDGGRVHHQQGEVGRAAGRPQGDRQDLGPGLVLEPLRPVPGEDGQGLSGDAGVGRQDHQDDGRAEQGVPAGVRRGLAGGRGQGRVLPEGDRVAEEVLRAWWCRTVCRTGRITSSSPSTTTRTRSG